MDPRGLVAAASLLALALIALSTMLLVRSTDDARRSVRYIEVAVERPLRHLGDALEANTAGQALLQRAVGATGEERSDLLARSIAAGETATTAWTRYRASALGLAGEDALASTYERDYERGKAIAGRILVPIIQSSTPTPLPAEQVAAAESNRRNLIALQALYEREDDAELRSLDQHQVSQRNAVLIAAAALAVIVAAGSVHAFRIARRAVAERRSRALSADLAELEARLVRAYEFADNDDDAFRVAARAVSASLPDATVAIAVADASRATFTPLVGAPSCGVEGIEQCRAFRAGAPLRFNDSTSLDTCPVLAAGASTPCAVTCVPVSVAGVQAAVVQLTGPVGMPPEMGGTVPLIVRRLGDRVTALRALARFQIQAAHDPLTGLLNRRSFEEAVGRLTADGSPYAVAFADLDHFKLLNDVHGHEVGDRALRAFATTLRTSLRPDDLVGRWGGEEFVVVLPDCEEQQAIEAMDRVRAQLASAALEGANVAVTVSVGIAVRDAAEPFDQAVARADQALHVAKAAGRDRVEAWRLRLDAAGPVATETDLPLLSP